MLIEILRGISLKDNGWYKLESCISKTFFFHSITSYISQAICSAYTTFHLTRTVIFYLTKTIYSPFCNAVMYNCKYNKYNFFLNTCDISKPILFYILLPLYTLKLNLLAHALYLLQHQKLSQWLRIGIDKLIVEHDRLFLSLKGLYNSLF